MSSLISEDSTSSSKAATTSVDSIDIPNQFTTLQSLLASPPPNLPNNSVSLNLTSSGKTLRVISKRQRKANYLTYLIVTDDNPSNPSEIELRLSVDGVDDPTLTNSNQSVVDALGAIDVGCLVTSFSGFVKYLDNNGCSSTKKKKFSFDRTVDCLDIRFLPPLHSEISVSAESSSVSETTTTISTSTTNPTILFDINYSSQMNSIEAKSLSRQLTMSYASNRRSPHPFSMVFSGTDLKDETSMLTKTLNKQNWESWKDVSIMNSEKPWDEDRFRDTTVVYLTADSPNVLTEINDNTTYIIGGLVDHTDKPFFSFDRATSLGLQTAKLPLDSGFKMLLRANRDGADVTTLSVVQTLLSIREFSPDLPLCIFKTPSFHCAPLRKYIKWIGEYEYLNETLGKGAGKAKKPGKGFSLVPAAVSIGEEVVSKFRGDEKTLNEKILNDKLELEAINS